MGLPPRPFLRLRMSTAGNLLCCLVDCLKAAASLFFSKVYVSPIIESVTASPNASGTGSRGASPKPGSTWRGYEQSPSTKRQRWPGTGPPAGIATCALPTRTTYRARTEATRSRG